MRPRLEPRSADLPQFVKVDFPVVASRFALCWVGVQWDIDALSLVEDDGGQVLVEERLKHDDLVSWVEEGGEDGVLTCGRRMLEFVYLRDDEQVD